MFTHFPTQFNILEKIIDQSGRTESTQSTQFSFVRTEPTIQHLYAKCSKGSAGDVSSALRPPYHRPTGHSSTPRYSTTAQPRAVVATPQTRHRPVRSSRYSPPPPLPHRPSAPLLARLFHRAADRARSALMHAPFAPSTNAALPLICSEPQHRELHSHPPLPL